MGVLEAGLSAGVFGGVTLHFCPLLYIHAERSASL